MSAPAYNTVAWFQVGTTDAEQAKGFYGDLFGWRYTLDPNSEGKYHLVSYPGAGTPSGGIFDTGGEFADSSASATVAWTEPWLAEPAAVARLWPAADRDTPETSVRSSAWSIAATIAGAVHPVIPAKQTLTLGRPYTAMIAGASARPLHRCHHA